jgi:Xaa-Pro aminopeptidase
MRPGVRFSEPDSAARQVLKKAGLGEHFVDITGMASAYATMSSFHS